MGDGTAWSAMYRAAALLVAVNCANPGGIAPAAEVVICRDDSAEPILFAARELRRALEEQSFRVVEKGIEGPPGGGAATRIVLALSSSRPAAEGLREEGGAAVGHLEPQGYAIRRTRGGTVWAIGADPAGAMYGGLHLAEEVRLAGGLGGIADRTCAPSIPMRGIKFNIPLDARTPSYDDSGDSAQRNIAEMWDFSFWEEFIDEMARHRYNVLTLWNPHPFPSMVRVPRYPDVTLPDVCVTTLDPEDSRGGGRWGGVRKPVSRDVLANLRVVRKMTIDEKMAHWRRVMRHAKDRGIDVIFITWNVYANGAEGKYGITSEQDNPATIAYMRESVREFILAYPDLAGLGVTAGENMKDLPGEFSKERWLWKTYGLGILDAKAVQPGRRVRFIHRVWETRVADVVKEWKEYPDTFELSYKYVHARLYSSPEVPFPYSEGLIAQMKPLGVKSWWNLRNDDIFNFRWGDPDYVRKFLANLPPRDLTAGYYVGSDGYVWGREFTSLQPDNPRALEIRKHWYSFMLWGRLGYDLGLDGSFFRRTLERRFPAARGAPLYEAWAEASRVIPLVNRFHWRDWDFMWAVEGCMDERRGFRTVRDFIRTPTMKGSGLLAVPEWARGELGGKRAEGAGPPEVAVALEGHASRALSAAEEVRRRASRPCKELRETLGDIEAMAHLGSYYAAKIRGAACLGLFDLSKEEKHRLEAVRHLEDAAACWERYAKVASSQYRPQVLARTRKLDWIGSMGDVRADVESARSAAR